jgi:hypothetical protein
MPGPISQDRDRPLRLPSKEEGVIDSLFFLLAKLPDTTLELK